MNDDNNSNAEGLPEITQYDHYLSQKAVEKLINKKFFFAFLENRAAGRILKPEDIERVLLESKCNLREKTVDTLFEKLKDVHESGSLRDLAIKIIEKKGKKENVYMKAQLILNVQKR